MQFSSLAEFIAMDGHGFNVWLSYGATAVLFIILTWLTKSKDKNVKLHIIKRQKRELKLKQAAEKQQVDLTTNSASSAQVATTHQEIENNQSPTAVKENNEPSS